MSINPNEYRLLTTFEDLSVGESFEFTPRTNVGGGSYNQTGRKTSEHTYRMGFATRRIGNLDAKVVRVTEVKEASA
jgi:hypothetical protein